MNHDHLAALLRPPPSALPPEHRAPDPTAGTTEESSHPAFTISVRTLQGRVFVTVAEAALSKLAPPSRDAEPLTILARHAPRFRALGLQHAHRDRTAHVTIDADAVWWGPDDVE